MRIASAVVLLFTVTALYADVPNEITYQGRLREYGQPVTGTRTMNFRIYRSATGPGTAWESGNVGVAVSSGTFAYTLTPDIDWRQKDYWIETTVSGKTLSPREKLSAQAYALHSRTAEDIEKPDGAPFHLAIGSNRHLSVQTSGNVGIGNTSPDTKLRVEGEAKSLVNGTTFCMVPRGAIIMWSGTIASIPAGWALCDGTNGTPDLRDRFILSISNASEPPGSIGGVHSYNLTIDQLPPHYHSGNTEESGSHSHTGGTAADEGKHTHSYKSYEYLHDVTGGGSGGFFRNSINANTSENEGLHTHTITTNSVDAHTHSFTSNSIGNGQTIDNRPAFFKLAFLMRL
jgi:microcystin-dependent protein